MFLIKLELEGLSKRKHVPTDYLQINGGEVIYGNKKNMVIFNDTENAVLKFKSDTWFNYQGFYIYFKGRGLNYLINLFEIKCNNLFILKTKIKSGHQKKSYSR